MPDNQIYSASEKSERRELLTMAIRKARYGHNAWLAWRDRQGAFHVARKTPASVKQCLLDTGTQGQWTLITADDGGELLGAWWMGINLLNHMKRGYY